MSYKTSNPIKQLFRKSRILFAKTWLNLHPEVDLIGITGSVGKTTTKEVVSAILGSVFPTLSTEKNFDPIFNIPITLLKIRKEEKVVMEMGVDGIGQMDEYLKMATPRIGIITRFSLAHADNAHFGSLDNLIKEKSKLVFSLPHYGWAILNGDDTKVASLHDKTAASALLYGFSDRNDLIIKNYQIFKRANSYHSKFQIKYGFQTIFIESQLLGKHNAMCITAAVAVAMVLGMKTGDIVKAVKGIPPVSQRLNIKKSKWGGIIIDDTYNSSPEAVKAALDLVCDFNIDKTCVVLGQMKELGKLSKKMHLEVGAYAKEKKIPNLITIGENAKDVMFGFGGGEECNTHSEIVSLLERKSPRLVLIKGSRGMQMEKVVEKILKG